MAEETIAELKELVEQELSWVSQPESINLEEVETTTEVQDTETNTGEEETPDTEETSEEETSTDELSEEAPKKKENKFKKILSEKNKYKREAEEAKAKLDSLMKESDWSTSKEMLDLMVKEQFANRDAILADKEERIWLIQKYPESKDVLEGVDDIRAEYPNMSQESAYIYYLANNNPSALADTQTKNKESAGKTSLTWATPNLNKVWKGVDDMSLDELRQAAWIELWDRQFI